MKKLIAIVLALALTGCVGEFGTRITDSISTVKDTVAAVAKFTITQGQLDTARTSYNGTVLASLRRYALLPRCKTGQSLTINNPCHDRLMLVKIRNADKVVGQGFKDTQARLDAGDDSGAVLAYDTLKIAIDTAKALIAKSGVEVL